MLANCVSLLSRKQSISQKLPTHLLLCLIGQSFDYGHMSYKKSWGVEDVGEND